MHSALKKLDFVQSKINEIINEKQLKTKPKIIVITKTFPMKQEMLLIGVMIAALITQQSTIITMVIIEVLRSGLINGTADG